MDPRNVAKSDNSKKPILYAEESFADFISIRDVFNLAILEDNYEAPFLNLNTTYHVNPRDSNECF
jgi:hypothetical protein